MLLQSDQEQSSLLKWDSRAGRSLRAHTNLTALSWPVRRAPLPGDLVVCIQAPDPPPLQIQRSPATARRYQISQNCSKGSPNLAQRLNNPINSVHFYPIQSTLNRAPATLRCRARQGRVAKGTKIRKISSLFSRNLGSAQRGKTHMPGTVMWSVRSKARPAGRGASPAGGNRMEGWQRPRNGHKREQQRQGAERDGRLGVVVRGMARGKSLLGFQTRSLREWRGCLCGLGCG